MAKDYAKSVRMTKKVFDYVDQFKGNGFNDKFENLVLHFMETEKQINNSIDFRLRFKNDLEEKIEFNRSILNDLDKIRAYVKQATQICNSKPIQVPGQLQIK